MAFFLTQYLNLKINHLLIKFRNSSRWTSALTVFLAIRQPFFKAIFKGVKKVRKGIPGVVLTTVYLMLTQCPRIFAQDIYYEDFDLPSGTTVDNGTTAWTRDISNANLGSNGVFETRSNFGSSSFRGSRINGEAVWISQIIDISNESSVQISADIAEFGNMENSDYLRLYYVVDGGNEVLFGDFNNDFGLSFQLVTSPEINGNDLQIKIRISNNNGETHIFDNVRVYGQSGGPTIYSRSSRNWNSILAWSESGLGGGPCFCTPDSDHNVVIGSNHTITLNTDGTARNITIQDNGVLTSPGAYDLNITGNISITSVNADPLTLGEQTLSLVGTGDQVLAVNNQDLFDVVINKSSGKVTLTQPLNLYGTLNFSSASEIASDGYLTLISTSDGTSGNASIGELSQGASVTGNVNVQRYISGEGVIYRYLATPVSNATVADWQDDFPITGNFDNSSSGPGIDSSTPSLYYYGESLSGENVRLGWIGYPSSGSSADNPLVPGTGYAAKMLDGANATLVDVTGTINQGDLSYSVSFAGSGWNLLGNPYPATVDWSNTTGWSRTNVANAVYVRNNENGDNNSVVASFVDGVGTNGGTGLIATMQSFWVQALGDNPSLQINERAKSGNTGTFFRVKEPLHLFRITLSNDNEKDEAVVRFSSNASFEYDPEMDARKFSNEAINLSTNVATQGDMAINTIPQLLCEQALQLKMSNTDPGSYQLNFTELERLNLPYTILLTDLFTESVMDISNEASYQFDITTDTATYRNRFELSIKPEPPAIVEVSHGHSCTAGALELSATTNYPEVSGLQFNWYRDADDPTPIEVNNSGTFTTPELAHSQSYFVSVSGPAGCESERVEVTASIVQFEPPTITRDGNSILKSNYREGNQWYYNGTPILNGNTSKITIDRPGTYRLEVTVSSCKPYHEIKIHPSDLFGMGNTLVIYPTPAKDFIWLSLPIIDDQQADINIYNTTGRLTAITPVTIIQRKAQVDISGLGTGVYYLEIYLNNRRYTSRFIKSI